MNLLLKIIPFIISILCCGIVLPASAALPVVLSENMKLKLEQVADGLGIPWGFEFYI